MKRGKQHRFMIDLEGSDFSAPSYFLSVFTVLVS